MGVLKSDTLKIAVTGGAGSGKTSVCGRLKELGLNVISSDTLAREVLLPDGALDRSKLRRIITGDDVARSALERFVHPKIAKLVQLKMAQAGKEGERFVVVEVPLLFELGIQDRFDVVVLISAERELRVQRLMERDSISKKEAKDLLDVQMTDDEKAQQSDFIIKNDDNIKKLMRSVDLFYKKLYQKHAKNGVKALDRHKIMI
ncbi:MAG: dephospho-CoA kinase [Deltaproteobacteria bacterium]|nr:dephospho-CoA kinase [Deltaproteobacteria bacterium]